MSVWIVPGPSPEPPIGTSLIGMDPSDEPVELTDADVIAVLLRQVADAAFRAGVSANEGLPTLGELKAAREAHVEEVVQRWRSAR